MFDILISAFWSCGHPLAVPTSPLHGKSLVLILAGALHSKFFSVIEEGVTAHHEVHCPGNLILGLCLVSTEISSRTIHIMIYKEGRIYGVRVIFPKEICYLDHLGCKGRRRLLARRPFRDQSILICKGEVKAGIDATGIIPGILFHSIPYFCDYIDVLLLCLYRIFKPGKIVDIRADTSARIFLGCIQAKTIHTMINPEPGNLRKFRPYRITLHIQVRHLAPEAAFIIIIASFQFLIACLFFLGEMIIIQIRTFCCICLLALGQ